LDGVEQRLVVGWFVQEQPGAQFAGVLAGVVIVARGDRDDRTPI
jgi:hypothetical protein